MNHSHLVVTSFVITVLVSAASCCNDNSSRGSVGDDSQKKATAHGRKRTPLIPRRRPLPAPSIGIKRPTSAIVGKSLGRFHVGMDLAQAKKQGFEFQDMTTVGSHIHRWKFKSFDRQYEVYADESGHVYAVRALMKELVMVDTADRRIVYTGKRLPSYEKQLPDCKRDVKIGATHWVCHDGKLRIISPGKGVPESILIEISDGRTL